MNAYEMLELLRDNINEATAAVHSDLNLVRRLSLAEDKVARMVTLTAGQWLVKSTSVTPVAGVITLPSDCAKPIYLRETSSKKPIEWLPAVTHEIFSRTMGSSLDPVFREAYLEKSCIVINDTAYATACTLWYVQRPPNLVVANAGNVATSGATFLLLPDDLNTRRVDDYYNNVVFHAVAGTGAYAIETVTDYAASTRKATVTGTYGADTYFGSVPTVPEETHGLIVLEATLSALSKPTADLDKDIYQRLLSELREERNAVRSWLASRIPGSTQGVLIGEDY